MKTKEASLWLVSKFNQDKCNGIKENAVILTNDNNVYFVINDQIFEEAKKPQYVRINSRRGLPSAENENPIKANSLIETNSRVSLRGIHEFIEEVTFEGGHAEIQINSLSYLQQSNIKLIGGQISSDKRIIIKKCTDDSLWRQKDSFLLREYLGSVAYRVLGINVPDFDIGIVEQPSMISGQSIFLQQYMADAKMCGESIIEVEMSKIIPVIVSIALLGDWDGIGMEGDNILQDSKTSALVKIDCGRTFQSLGNSSAFEWLFNAQHPGNALFNSIVQKYIIKDQYSNEISRFLKTINFDNLNVALDSELKKFNQILSKNDGFPKKIKESERDFHNREEIGVIALLQVSKIKSILALGNLIKQRADGIVAFIEQQKKLSTTSIDVRPSSLTSTSVEQTDKMRLPGIGGKSKETTSSSSSSSSSSFTSSSS